LAPEALIRLAGERGVGVLALTDHDTVAGLEEAETIAREIGMAFINGVEISVNWNNRVLHIVGLNVDPHDRELLAGLQTNIDQRYTRAEMMYRRFRKLGVSILEEVEGRVGKSAPTRTHFARALVEIGVVKDVKQAFKRYLGHGKPGYVSAAWAPLQDAVTWIRNAGGNAVLAHPRVYGFTRTRLRSVVQSFVEAGGEAIEVVTGNSTAAQTRDIALLAEEYGLCGSVGSDFHTPENHWAMVGRCAALPASLEPVWGRWS
jgi:predicted metal-dependent phosphoesterase TrpH